jgi:hypothetical protein
MEPLQSFRGQFRSGYDLRDPRARAALAADAAQRAKDVAAINAWLNAQCRGCPSLK